MRKVLIAFIGLCWLLSACHKEEAPTLPTTALPNAWEGPQSYGWVKADRDGKAWAGSCFATIQNGDNTRFGLEFATSDADTTVIEDLAFVRIPLKVGRYTLSNNATTEQSVYWVGYFDEIDALYKIANNTESYLWIDSYDPTNKLITGHFQSFYTKSDNFRFNYPDFVAFSDGTFSVKLY